MTQHLIKGCKGGSSSPRTPTEQPDDLQSVAKAKVLLALGEGEFAGALTAKDIYLDGTPLENSDGSQNFSGVAWEFRPGTQAQNYIQGIPGSENEINVGMEVSSKTAWSRSFSNTQLSAVRLRLKWPSLLKQEDNGDLVGNTVSYAVDLQTDGGSWQTVLESAVSGKTTAGYERCHRIDLPRSTTGWVLRLRKVTQDANSSKTGDVMMLQSYAEVLDAKLRYPNTALLYVEFDSRLFNGSIPKISCSPRGRVIRVPDNYDPETREYSGIWTGAFKWAWTDNPAWIFYDLIVSDRFGLGNRLTSENIDKWTLYQVARYCDEPVPDGKGGDGTEPRYLCNVYVQNRNDAYTVLRDFAAIFRGMTCWSGDQVIALADMPRDIDYTYTRANVINGRFQYASSSSKTRYTNALVSWSDPENEYADAMEPVFEQPLVARYGFNQLELTAIGCTRQSEANRKGRWGILTNNKDRVVTFSVGLDGNIPQPGYVIAVADEMLAGKVNGGRTSEVDGCVITLDRQTEAKAGDRLLLNLPSGVTQSRTIEDVNGHVVTVTAEYAELPETECVWAIESDSLRVQQYRVVSVKDNNDSTFTISAAAHDPDKYARIDTGAIIDSRPISVIPPGNQNAPANIVVESYSVVNQGISVETLQVHWAPVKNAIAYEAQWRRNEGNWVNVPRSSVTSFDVGGIYAGRYTVRVRAINAAEVSSGWAYSDEKILTGKIGMPVAPIALTTTSLLHGVELQWAFPDGAGDTQKTELQYSPNPNGSGAMALSDVTYPGKTYQQMGLQIAATFWYRARIVDRLGNESPWTSWVQGMASDDIDEYYDKLTDAIKDTEAWQEAQRDIGDTHKALTETADAIRDEVAQQVTDIHQNIDDTVGGLRKQVDGQIESVNKSITENIDLVNQTLNDNISAVNQSLSDAVTEMNTSVDQQIADVNKVLAEGDSALKSQLQTVENSLKQSIAQANTGWDKAVKQETADRIADVNAKAAQAADQLLNEKNERVAAIDNLQTVIQDGDESLARQIAEISAGSGQQFDSFSIWYFDKDNEGWTEDDAGQVPMQITDEGWLKASNSTASCRSPNGQTIPASSYRTIMLRIKRVGNPVWKGRFYWIGADEQGWNDARSVTIAEQEFDGDGISVVAIPDVNWNASGTVRRFRIDLAQGQNADNYFLIHWISVGRPAPAASTAALRNEEMARTQADEAEAMKRSTLAAQIRGTTDSNSLSDLRSGLLYQEMNARITADRAEVVARESLQTQFNENKSTVAEELSSLSTAQSAQASKISGLETSLGKKADATALQSLTQKVEQQGGTLTSQGNSLTSLTNRVGKTESGVSVNSSAITGLQSSVSKQDKTLTSQSQALTKLQNDLTTTNASVNKKAEASALQTLQNTVTQQEKAISASNSSITSLQTSINRRTVFTITSRGNGSSAKDGVFDESGNKLFGPSRSYSLVTFKTNSNGSTSIDTSKTYDLFGSVNNGKAMSDDIAALANGVYTCVLTNDEPTGYRSSITSAIELLGGTTEVINSLPYRGAYILLGRKGMKPGDGLELRAPTGGDQGAFISTSVEFVNGVMQGLGAAGGVMMKAEANASAITNLQNTVTQQGKDITSASSAITSLQNGLKSANDTISKKADATALQSLQNTVIQQGSKLTTQSNAITSLENNLGVTNANLDGLRGMGGNLVENGDFAQGVACWGLQQGGQDTVTFGNFGESAKGAKLVKIGSTSPGIFVGKKRPIPITGLRKYRFVVRAKGVSGAKNMLLRRWNFAGGKEGTYEDKNIILDAGWKTYTWNTLLTPDTGVDAHAFGLYCHPNASEIWIDSFYIFDITDEVNIAANATALSALSTTVSNQGNSLTSQSNSLTSLSNSIGTLQAQVGNPWFDGSLESYADGAQVGNTNQASVTTAQKFTGSKSLRVKRLANEAGNSDKFIGTRSAVRENGVFRIELWAMMPANQTPSGGWSTIVGINVRNAAGANAWQTAITINEASLGGRDKWVKFSGKCTLPSGKTQGVVWISCRGATGSGTPGYELYLDDVVITDITDANEAQNLASANASALTTLTSRVTKAEGTITSQSSSITKLTNDLSTTNANVNKKADATALTTLQNTVTQQGKDINSASSAITSLQNGLKSANDTISKKADATALQSLQNTVTQQESKLTTQSNAITSLENNLGVTNANLDGLRGMGGNLVENGDFALGAACWGLQQGGQDTVTFGNYGDGSKGAKLVKVGSTSPGIFVGNKRPIPITGQRRYRFVVRAKGVSGAKNILLRRWNYFGGKEGVYENKALTLDAGWNTYTWNTLLTPESGVDAHAFGLYCHPSAAEIWIDSFYIFDITDEMNIASNASAVSALDTKVTKAEGNITSQGNAITRLNNDLATMNGNVNKKADASALTALTNRVTETEKTVSTHTSSITRLQSDLSTTNGNVAKKAEQTALNALSSRMTQTENNVTSANSNITSLTAAVRAGNASSGDLVSNPTFDPAFSQMGFNVVSSTSSGVPTGCPFANVAKLAARDHHPNWAAIPATLNDVFEISALVACGAGSADFNFYIGTATSSNGSIGSPLATGGNTKKTTAWTRATWKVKVTQTMVDRGYIRPFLQINQSSPFGTIWYVTDWHFRNITAAYQAQNTADATAKALDTLSNTVTQQGKDISSVSQRATNLENSLKTTNDNVNKKADAAAFQTLQSTVTEQGKTLNSQSSSITTLNNNVSTTNSNIDSLRGLGGNLVENGNFAQGAVGWGLQQNAQNPITFGDYGDGGKGVKLAKVNTTTSPGIFVSNKRPFPANGQRRYRFVVRAKGVSGAKNMLLRRWNYSGGKEGTYEDKTLTLDAGWNTYTWNTSLTPASGVDAHAFGLYCHPTAAEIWIDSFYVFDITDEMNNSANATALSSLQNTVTQQGKDITASNSNVTSLQASLGRRTVFTIVSKGNGSSAKEGIFDESGNKLFSPGRSYALVTFKTNSNGSTSINTSKTYDVFGSSANGKTMSDDIAALANGVYVCILTNDEPTGYRSSITAAFELLGGTTEVINSLPYRGAYILLGRKGMKAGDGLELRSPTGGDQNAFISTSVEFVNGVMMGLGAAGGVMMKADANASAITALQNTVTQQGKDITSASSSLTSLENSLKTANDNISKKADAAAVTALTNRVSKTENTLSSQSENITKLTNNLNATNENVKLKADTSALNALTNRVATAEGKITSDGTAITSLNNSVTNLNNTKATVTALNALTTRVTAAEGNISSQSTSITNLTSSLDATAYQGVGLNPNGRFNTGLQWWSYAAGTGGSIDWAANIGEDGSAGVKMTKAGTGNPVIRTNGSSDSKTSGTFELYPLQNTSGGNVGRPIIVRVRAKGVSGAMNLMVRFIEYPNSGAFSYANDKTLIFTTAFSTQIAKFTAKTTTVRGRIEVFCYPANASVIISSIVVEDNTANEAKADGTVTAKAVDVLTADVKINKGNIESNSKSLTSLINEVKGKATSSALSTLESKVNIQGKDVDSHTKQLLQLNATAGDNTAKIKQQSETIASLDKTVSASWTLKVEVDSKGNKIVGGVVLGADSTGTSQFLINANRLALINNANGAVSTPFVVDSGVTYMNAAYIKNGSITSAKVGDIQSNNYVGGSQGWRITKSGASEFNNVVVRGEVHANSGTFTGTVHATDGYFNGTVYANKIEGDVMIAESNTIPLKNYSDVNAGDYEILKINGDDFDRSIDTNLVVQVGSGFRNEFKVIVQTPGRAEREYYSIDTGNNGGVRAYAIRGFDLPAAGKGQQNRIIVRVRDSGRASGIMTYTPYVPRFDGKSFDIDSNGNTINRGYLRERAYIAVFRKGNRIVA
ncbi:phage tail tip protein [Klebsiella oxytoca]